MAVQKLKVAVLGAGKIGYAHIDGYVEHPRSEVVALVDTSEERLKACADKYGIRYRFTDYREMLKMKEIDIVSVALPNFLHAVTSLAALKAGKHVHCDKPMAMNYAEAQKIMAAAKAQKKLFMVGQNFRFADKHQILKHVIARGDIGDTYHAHSVMLRRNAIPKMGTWFTHKHLSGGGTLIDIGVHILDFTLHLMGSFDAEAVTGIAYDKFGSRDIGRGSWGMSDVEKSKVLFDVDDYAAAMLKLKGGKTVMFEVSWHAYVEPCMNVRVLGTEGGVSLNPFKIQRRKGNACETIENVEMEKGLPYPANRIVHFVDCVLNRKLQPLVPVEESVKLQRILDAIYTSSATGREVRLK